LSDSNWADDVTQLPLCGLTRPRHISRTKLTVTFSQFLTVLCGFLA